MTPTLPTLIVDSREQCPLRFQNLPTEIAGLQTADYSIKGMEESFGVERKSPADLVGSCLQDRDRFSRELHRLRGYAFGRLLIVGSPSMVARHITDRKLRANPVSVLATVHAINARYVPVLWIPTAEAAALEVERMAFWHWREALKPAGIKPQTPPWAVDMPESSERVVGHPHASTQAI